MFYSIKPLLLGKAKVSKAQMTYFVDYDKWLWAAFVAWYIKVGEKNILVDTGISPLDIQRYLYMFREYEEISSFEGALSSIRLTPEDIDIVIQTHLHFDHCGNTLKCKNAIVIVQEEELNFAYSPHAVFFGSYNPQFFKDLRFRVVSGNKEILPGIEVIHIPGHSPGTQAVSVQTEKGRAIISGFCSIRENFFPPEKMRTRWPVIAPGVSVNPLQAFDSALKIRSLADIIIPLHDIEFAQLKEIP